MSVEKREYGAWAVDSNLKELLKGMTYIHFKPNFGGFKVVLPMAPFIFSLDSSFGMKLYGKMPANTFKHTKNVY